MKKVASVSTIVFIILLIAGCGSSSHVSQDGQEDQQGVSITATQPTAWEGSEDYLEFVIDLGSPNGTAQSLFVFFEATGSGLERDDMDGVASLLQEYVEIPPGSQTASMKLEGFASDGSVTETQPIKITLAGCSSTDFPIGSPSEATAIIMDADGEVVYDIDGNRYRTVLIGSQTWMVENLETYSFRNGDRIYESWSCNNDYNNDFIYGRLYNWYVIMDVRGLAPEGWHVPTKEEWEQLIDYLGGKDVAGGKLKATTLWKSPNTGATNESGFTAFPGGARRSDGAFLFFGEWGNFWNAAADFYENFVTGESLYYASATAFFDHGNQKSLGVSVRCIRD